MRFLVSGWVITVVAVLATLGLKESPTETPHAIADLAVREIDEHYLYASSAAWTMAREKIVSSTAADHGSMYAFIARQLASIRDSELHLVAPFELSAIQSESEGKRLGVGLMEFSIDLVPSTGEARIVTPLIVRRRQWPDCDPVM